MVNDAERDAERWDARADSYDRTPDWVERALIGDSRAWLVGQARGDTLEVAAGTGLNLPHYAAGVRLTAVDLSPGMLRHARARASELGLAAEVREADATSLPFADAAFDTVVCTLAVCSLRDRGAALDEMVRVLRPGGLLLLIDHVERRWFSGRPATLALRRGVTKITRRSLRLGAIDLLVARKT
jgi:ubiquinone/menaquinone biosynthesis C-methylase UbiE